ncbi:protease B nonderepressible form, partial [Coemansia erecta]
LLTPIVWFWAALAPVHTLSHSHMSHPDPNHAASNTPLLEAEDHVIFGHEPTVVPSKSDDPAAAGWNLTTVGASWHVWNYESIVDRLDMPLWPDAMEEARVVLSSEMCRHKIHLPPAPFMPQPGIEYCGIHVSATAGAAVAAQGDVEAAAARIQMRQWMSAFMEWSPASTDEGTYEHNDDRRSPDMISPASFVNIGASGIYYFKPFAPSHALSGHMGSRLDLIDYAVGSGHILRELAFPQVLQRGRSWLDNHRVEISLRRTPQGFVKVAVQSISLVHPSADISVLPRANATSQLAWIGPTQDSRSFVVSSRAPGRAPLEVPSVFYAQHDTSTQPGGTVTERTRDFSSFHPSLHIVAQADLIPRLESGSCRIDTFVFLPPTYFFDPYQLHEVRGGLGMDYRHYGPVELEKPAEVMRNWGSILHIWQRPHLTELDALVPIHARYRLPPVLDRTVGYSGEPAGTTHVDTALLPAIAAVMCPTAEIPRLKSGNSILDKLNVRLALLDELGLAAFSVLTTSPDTDTLVRMPVGDATYASQIRTATLVAFGLGAAYVVWFVRNLLSQKKTTSADKPTTNKGSKRD